MCWRSPAVLSNLLHWRLRPGGAVVILRRLLPWTASASRKSHGEQISKTPFTSVSAGGRHTSGGRLDGTLACWGSGAYGQGQAAKGEFTSVSSGGTTAAACASYGTIACWSDKGVRQATTPEGTNSLQTVPVVATCVDLVWTVLSHAGGPSRHCAQYPSSPGHRGRMTYLLTSLPRLPV